MIKIACRPPAINAQCLLKEGLPILGFSAQNRAPILASFGIEISENMTDIPARILSPPQLSYRSGAVRVNNGAWNIVNVKFHRGAKVGPYWVLYVNDNSVAKRNSQVPAPEQLTNLVKKFQEKCASSGMDISGSKPAFLTADLNAARQGDDFARTRALRIVQNIIEGQLAKTGKPSLILVLLRGIDKFIYPGIKVVLPLFRFGVADFFNSELSASVMSFWVFTPSICYSTHRSKTENKINICPTSL